MLHRTDSRPHPLARVIVDVVSALPLAAFIASAALLLAVVAP